MTNLRDLLDDFAEDIKTAVEDAEAEAVDFEEEKEDLIADLLDTINKRLLGNDY